MSKVTNRKNYIVGTLLILVPIVLFLFSMCIGRYYISPKEVLLSLTTMITGQDFGITSEVYTVVVNIRLQRALQALLVGASLAVSGACFQGLFRNPLVSSSILGVSNGAGFGAALAILLFNGLYSTPIMAFIFGVLAVAMAYFIGKISGTAPTITLVLGGVIVQSIFSALLSLIKYMADPYSQLPAITFWLMGSLASTKTMELVIATIPMVVGIVGALLMRWRLNVLSMGDREARTLGINVNRNKMAVISFATLAAAGAVSVSGIIGWVGLVVPHICRMIMGSDNRLILPASISVGGSFMIFVDTICRSISSSEIPVGIVTAIVGGPFFIYLLKKTKGKGWG